MGVLNLGLCMCLREREPLILSQQELGLNFGLVSSAQQETFLSWLPKGGAPAPATNTAAQARDEEGSVRMERHSGFQEQEHVLDLWSTQVTQNDAEKKRNYFTPYVPLRSVFSSFLLPPSKWELSLRQSRSGYCWKPQLYQLLVTTNINWQLMDLLPSLMAIFSTVWVRWILAYVWSLSHAQSFRPSWERTTDRGSEFKTPKSSSWTWILSLNYEVWNVPQKT